MIYEGGEVPLNASLTNLATRSLLAAALTTSQVLTGLDLRLFKAGPNPNSGMKLADFTEADFSGYALVTGVTFGPPVWDNDKATVAAVQAGNKFTGTDGTTINIITHFGLTDGATSTANIIFCEKLSTPATIGAANSSLTVIPVIPLVPVQK